MKNFIIAMVIVITFLFSGSALAGGGFTFKVTFNQDGDVIQVEHDIPGTLPGNTKIATYPMHFRYRQDQLPHGSTPAPIDPNPITIDLNLLILNGDDPCITHNGRRYCW
jgi:hypothetical protein